MARVSKQEMETFNSFVVASLKADFNNGLVQTSMTRSDIENFQKRNNVGRYPHILTKSPLKRGLFDVSRLLNTTKTTQSKSKVKETEEKSNISSVAKTEESTKTQEYIKPMLRVVSETDKINISMFVPNVDSNYIPFGQYKDVETIVKSRNFFPVFISGPTGNGKTSMVEQIHAKHNLPMIRHNINSFTDEEQLIGRQTLRNGNVEVIEGPIITAMRHGFTVLLDEISAAHPNTILCLMGILEGKPYYFKLKNELVHPAPGFNIIATDNTKGQGSSSGKYVGTNILNEAFLERFPIMIEQEYPNEKLERAIIKQLMVNKNCYNESILNDLVKWSVTIRMTFEQGASSDLITTRRMGHIINTYAMFKNIKQAITMCVSRFDENTKENFIELWNKIVDPDTTAEINPASPSDLV